MTQQSLSLILQTITNHLIPSAFFLHLNTVTVRAVIAMFTNPLNPLPAQNQTAYNPKGQLPILGLDLWGWRRLHVYCSATLASRLDHILSPFHSACVSIFLQSQLISCLLIYGMAWVSGNVVLGVFTVFIYWAAR